MSTQRINEKSGVTNEQLDAWAEQFERGEWPGTKTVLLGRPRLANEELRTVTFKLPVSKIMTLDERATARGCTRSEELREAIDEYLLRA
jgi:hypothetical protein